MAAAHVQFLGGAYNLTSGHTSTILSPSSKTVTVGNVIVVALQSYYGIEPTGVTDNLGNTYTLIETKYGGAGADNYLYYAPVTTGGSLTTITVAHPGAEYTQIIASEFSGVGTLAATGAGGSGTGTTATGVTNKTTPANGLAVWAAAINTQVTPAAGAASGSPSTSISVSGSFSAGAGTFTVSLCYALAGASAVTGFTGTTTWTGSQTWSGTGGLFNAGTAQKTINGLAKASIKTKNSLAIASVSKWNGLA